MSADKVRTCWKSSDKSRPTKKLADDRFLSDDIVGRQKSAVVGQCVSFVWHRLK